ncbi:hypothetical protein T06_15586 [Trichinella sp. T6]|nr:hypothetical protein T06_15586 [Trichinella sp. T6]
MRMSSLRNGSSVSLCNSSLGVFCAAFIAVYTLLVGCLINKMLLTLTNCRILLVYLFLSFNYLIFYHYTTAAAVAAHSQVYTDCADQSLIYDVHPISELRKTDFLFFGVVSDVDLLEDCVRLCYKGTFCRSAIFDPVAKQCKFGYAALDACGDDKEKKIPSPRIAEDISIPLIVTCIFCPGQPRALDPISTAPLEDQAKNASLLSSSLNAAENSGSSLMYSISEDPSVVDRSSGILKTVNIPEMKTKRVKPEVVAEKSATHNSTMEKCFTDLGQQAVVKSAYLVYRGYSLTDCQCSCAQAWLGSNGVCSSIQYYPERQECVLNRISAVGSSDVPFGDDLIEVRTMATSLYEFTCKSDRRRLFKYLFESCSESRVLNSESKWKVECHDIVVGHSLKGAAAALERDVSIEECRCLCFGSVKNEKFNFVCRSASYFPKERNCILNVYDRWQRPDLFKQEADFSSVMYLDASCEGKKLAQLTARCAAVKEEDVTETVKHTLSRSNLDNVGVKVDENYNQKAEFLAEPLTPKPTLEISVPPGEYTDSCFLEISGYALSGSVEHSKSHMTLEECKCMCVDSEGLYGFRCLSLMYIWDTGTCWLNKFNRAQRPRQFSKITFSPDRFSYFDYLCTEKGNRGQKYVEQCATQQLSQDIPRPGFIQGQDVIAKKVKAAAPSVEVSHASPNAVQSEPMAKPVMSDISSSVPVIENETKRKIVADNAIVEARRSDPEASSSSSYSAASPSTTKFEDKQSTTAATEVPLPGEESLTTAKFDVAEYAGGSCTYSAFFDAEFNGRQLIEKFLVQEPLHCFVECAKRNCRSANLSVFLGKFKHCYLYADSAVEYPFTNMITFRKSSVYFEGISCAKRPTANSTSLDDASVA